MPRVKKKKRRPRYQDVMFSIIADKTTTMSRGEEQEAHKVVVEKSVGGGKFSKLEHI